MWELFPNEFSASVAAVRQNIGGCWMRRANRLNSNLACSNVWTLTLGDLPGRPPLGRHNKVEELLKLKRGKFGDVGTLKKCWVVLSCVNCVEFLWVHWLGSWFISNLPTHSYHLILLYLECDWTLTMSDAARAVPGGRCWLCPNSLKRFYFKSLSLITS